MSTQRSAEIQAALEGISLPATRDELVAYARLQADERTTAILGALPDREYRTIDEVGEELVHVQPSLPQQVVQTPSPESGAVPGGVDYTNPSPEPGGARTGDPPPDNPPQKALEQQSQLQQTQKAKQEG
jgi:hypothetical protein